MNQIKERNCVVCSNTFNYRTKGAQGKHFKIKNLRGKNMITCSRKCSKIYNRIAHYIYTKQTLEKRKSKNYGKIQ